MTRVPSSFRALVEYEPVEIIRAAVTGTEVHLVGGALRDCYLELTSPDLDIVVASDGREIGSLLADCLDARLVLLGGDRFAAYRVVRDDLIVDIWDRQGAPILSDLERRDFTINAIALDLRTGGLLDPFGGVLDLERRLLRAVSDTSFRTDPLRSLRLVRFALLLPHFTVEPRTTSLARAAAHGLDEVASERIRDEVTRVFRGAGPVAVLESLSQVGLFPRLWTGGERELTDAERLRSALEAYERTEGLCLDLAGRSPDRLLTAHALIARFLPSARIDSPSRQNALLNRSQSRAVHRLAAVDDEELDVEPRRFLARWGSSWLEAAAVSASLTRAGEAAAAERICRLRALERSEGPQALHPRPLLDGVEIQNLLGIQPGPAVGQLLNSLLDAQLRGEVTSKEDATRFIRGLPR